ncbi:MAG TPA: type II secretion system protein [Candidatus Paceibacterota bacterium]
MKKGFTLLELLIVIGILAILATATVLVLNPAELLKQARDSQRVTDLSALRRGINVYITAVSSTYMASTSNAQSNATCKGGSGTYTCYSDRSGALSVTCGGRYSSGVALTSLSRKTDAGGWLPIKFSDIPGGSPLPQLPTDPSNTANLYYAYACNSNLTFVLTAAFESNKFNWATNSSSPAGVDGGSSTAVYEIGTTPLLNGSGSGM